MKIQMKKLSVAIALVALLTIGATCITALPVGATKIRASCWVAETPNPTGVGQTVNIVGWITPAPPLDGEIYYNLTFTITKPDGTTDVHIMDSEAEAAASYRYVCNSVGTYKVVLSYPGDDLHNSGVSAPYTWTVQQEPVSTYPPGLDIPLPSNERIQYPISAEYREWYQISGKFGEIKDHHNELNFGFNPYSKAPNTAHIIWKEQLAWGGLLGGESGWDYLWRTEIPNDFIAAQGRLYWTTSGGVGTPAITGGSTPTTAGATTILHCVDIYTGEGIYEKELPVDTRYTGTAMLVGLEDTNVPKPPYWDEATQKWIRPLPVYSLWLVSSNGLYEVDATTGQVLYYEAPLPAALRKCVSYQLYDQHIYGFPKGSTILVTAANKTSTISGNLTKWSCRFKNTVWTFDQAKLHPEMDLSRQWNQIWPEGNMLVILSQSIGAFGNGYNNATPTWGRLWSWNATNGDLICRSPILEDKYASNNPRFCVYDGKLYQQYDDGYVYAISVYTGEIVWKSDKPGNLPWASFSTYGGISTAYGMIYLGNYDGYLRAYNTTTGKEVWEFFCGNTTENAMGVYSTWGNRIIADGKVYQVTGEHTLPTPAPRGNKLWCVDAFTGEPIWSYPLSSSSTNTAGGGIHSGCMWQINEYDGCLYMFGKGETATTVTAPTTVVPFGSSVLIQGTVTDQSSGAKDTPAIADKDMSEWMAYLYQQRLPKPTVCEGVPVYLQAMRSDGTLIDITHVTSDIMGHYEYIWTPPDTDTYKILATFEGSESYWSSSAQTALGVTAAPEASTSPEAIADNTNLLYGILAAAVVAIIIGAVAILLILRRK